MTFEEKAGIVISQLRADRDRLLDALGKIRVEIVDMKEGISSYFNDRPWVFKDEVLQIIDKYTAEEEDCSYEDLINSLEQ